MPYEAGQLQGQDLLRSEDGLLELLATFPEQGVPQYFPRCLLQLLERLRQAEAIPDACRIVQRSDSEPMRDEARRFLEQMADVDELRIRDRPGATQRLRDFLTDGFEAVPGSKVTAARALATVGDTTGRRLLLERMAGAQTDEPGVALSCGVSLLMLEQDREAAVAAVTRLLDDDRIASHRRVHAAERLAGAGSERGMRWLESNLSATEPRIRWMSARTLARMGNANGLACLAAVAESGGFDLAPLALSELRRLLPEATEDAKRRATAGNNEAKWWTEWVNDHRDRLHFDKATTTFTTPTGEPDTNDPKD
jgi:hypothetical protein